MQKAMRTHESMLSLLLPYLFLCYKENYWAGEMAW